jgi:predicted membrane-bound spermidine synthase
LSRISSVSGGPAHWSHLYLAVALTTLATLMLELSLTRIFSVVFYYHFAFLAISIALFGLGVGGVLGYLIQAKGKNVYNRLGTLAGVLSLVTVASVVIVLTRSEPTNLTLAIIYFTSALPFIFAGIIVSTAITESIERVHRVYFWDLIGAAAGCMLLVPFLDFFGGPTTVIVVAVLFAVTSAIWFYIAGNRGGRIAGVALALLLVALVIANLKMRIIDVRFAKGQQIANESFVKWNSFSRIAIVDRGSGMQEILIDADASTGIANFDFNNLSERDRRDLTTQGPGYVYQIRPGGRTLIIGPGGGWDVARAIASGAKDITGVEINPIIADTIMRRNFPHLSQNLYSRPEVRIVVEDGRSFVRRTPEKYQIIQATLVDTWASTAAGAFALSENNLYTTEAFYDYLSHLTDDGILAFTRWGFDPPRESLRLVSLARVALDRLGERDHSRHVIVVREGGAKELAGWGARDTVLISRKPFSDADIEHARAAAAASGMTLVYIPGTQNDNEFSRLLATEDPKSFYSNYRYDVSPVDDNRPFFFYTVQPRDLLAFWKGPSDSADYKINRAVPLLFGLMGISILSTLIVLLLPPLLLGARLPAEPGVRRFLLYFVCLGVGYILIQVALIQKFVLLLGHPTYALTLIVFSMLVASGIGSSVSKKLLQSNPSWLFYVLAMVTVLVTILALAAPAVLRAAAAWPLWARCVVTIVLIAPPAFFMGMPFPAGLQRLELWHPPSVRWAWALNAASSVLGSATAIFLAIYLGLRETLVIGGMLYIAAAALMKSSKPKAAGVR